MAEKKKKVRIAATADIHIQVTDSGKWTKHFKAASHDADIMIICGDLTNTGDEAEAQVLSDELKSCTIPVVAVLGNHDYEKGRQKLIRQIVQDHHNVHILDGEAVVLSDVGFAGVKGFGGGFDGHMLAMFGEPSMKAFVQEAVNEALLLDRALARLDQEHPDIKKIAVMHYSPIQATIEGEPQEIYPFLGSSRLAEPLTRRKVVAAFHGHAHLGKPEGKLPGEVLVFNVAQHVLQLGGHTTPFLFFEV